MWITGFLACALFAKGLVYPHTGPPDALDVLLTIVISTGGIIACVGGFRRSSGLRRVTFAVLLLLFLASLSGYVLPVL